MKRSKINSGYTIMEVLLVIGIIAIGAAVSGLSIRAILPDIRLGAAARALKSDLNLARLTAIRENRAVLIVFHKERKRYDIRLDTNGNNKPDDGDARIKTVLIPDGLNFAHASFGFGSAWTRFNSRGLASGKAGRASLRNTNRKQKDVFIALSGRVRIDKH